MAIKQRRLLGKTKPQATFSEVVRAKAKKQFSEWLQGFELDFYHANLLSNELLDRAIDEKVSLIPASAPDVYISDNDKAESLVMAMKKIADQLDEQGKLEDLLGELEVQDSRREGNSL